MNSNHFKVTLITDRNGTEIYIGRYYFKKEFPNNRYPIRRRLIEKDRVDYKDTQRGKQRRSHQEQVALLERLYSEKKEELLEELKAKEEQARSDTFESLFELWIQNARSLKRSERTIKDHYLQVKRIWLDVFPNMRLNQFQKTDLIRLREHLIEIYPKESSINSRIKTFRAFFTFLYDVELLDRPIKFNKITEDDRNPKVLTTAQIQTLHNHLLEKLNNRYSKHVQALIRFIWLDYYTGARRNEILYARRENFFIKERLWVVEKGEGFSIKERQGGKRVVKKSIPLSNAFIRFFLSDQNREDKYYLGDHPNGQRPIYSETGLSHALRREMNSLGFSKDVKPAHFFRAKLPTDLLNKHKVPLKIAADVLNHSSTAVTEKHYIKKQMDVLLEAVDMIEGFV